MPVNEPQDEFSFLREGDLGYEGDELMDTVTVMRVRSDKRGRTIQAWLGPIYVFLLALIFMQAIFFAAKLNRSQPSTGPDLQLINKP